MDSNIELVKLNSDASFPQDGEQVTVAGWGRTNEANFFGSDLLMAVDVNTMSNADCSASTGSINGVFDSYAGKITHTGAQIGLVYWVGGPVLWCLYFCIRGPKSHVLYPGWHNTRD